VKGRWLRMLAAMIATPNIEWFLRELAPDLAAKASGEKLYRQLESLAAKIPAGADGVIFQPYLFPGGERGPFVKPSARASFTGLSLNHTRAHMLRAVYEGVALATLDCYRHMPIDPQSVLLSGGGAQSPLWCQIVADCLGKPVHVPDGSQFGALGAAINVGVATGTYKTTREAVKRCVRTSRSYRPARAKTKLYAELYHIYRQTTLRQMDLWDAKSRLFA
jgi:sugar (pentulose or hexulose) kinase